MDKVQQVTEIAVSDEDIAAVKRNENKIREAYIEFHIPENFDGSLPEINTDME